MASVADDLADSRQGSKESKRGNKERKQDSSRNESGNRAMFDFCDRDQMKEDVKKRLIKEPYDVKDFYKKTGFWQKIARHPVFENFTLVVIAINAIWMWIDTDYNGGESPFDTHTIFLIGDQLFCVYFSFEWFARYQAFEKKRNGLKDAWFVFDSILVFLMVSETWILFIVLAAFGMSGGLPFNASILRLLRLARLSRMLRMLRSMPELLILVKGMGRAMKSVGYVMVLLMILMYVFAIAFVMMLKESDSGIMNFPSIPAAMWTLFCAGTLLDGVGAVLDQIGEASMLAAGGFVVFIALSALMVMNMLIGVLCEVVSAVADYEREQMLMAFVKERMEHCLHHIDEDGDGTITRKEFWNIVKEKEAVNALQECGVDPLHLIEFTDQIFEEAVHTIGGDDDEREEEPALTFECFMEVILRYRGTNTATVADIMDYRKFLLGYVDTKIKKQTKDIMTMIQLELRKRDFLGMPQMPHKSPSASQSFGMMWEQPESPQSPQSPESSRHEPPSAVKDPISHLGLVEKDLRVSPCASDPSSPRLSFSRADVASQPDPPWVAGFTPPAPGAAQSRLQTPPVACEESAYPKNTVLSNGAMASCSTSTNCAEAEEDAVLARIQRLSDASRKKILAMSENTSNATTSATTSTFKRGTSYSTLGNTTECSSEVEDSDSVVRELPASSIIAGKCQKPGPSGSRRE